MLKGEKITLRRADLTDLEFLFKLENNPDNSDFTTINREFSREELTDFINDFTPIQISGQLRFLIIENKENKAIGTIDLFDADFLNQNASVGIIIAEDHFKSKGFGSEALELLIHYSKNRLELINLICSVKATNSASIKLFEKAGFKKVGIKKEWYFHEVNRIDEFIYQLCLKEI